MTLVLLFAVFLLQRLTIEASLDCRKLHFLPIHDGKRLRGHIIQNTSATKEDDCGVKCYMEKLCVTYNFGGHENGQHICELSDSDHQLHPNDLVLEEGYIYRPVENACASSPCSADYRCLIGFGDEDYACEPALESADVDECAIGTHDCSPNATCTNTDGSFTCSCIDGYLGDGITCTENPYGLHEHTAGGSCKDIKGRTSTLKNKEYWINANSSVSPFKVYCDMTTDGGGWTLVKRTLVPEDVNSLAVKFKKTADYTEIANYATNHQIVPADQLAQLRADMGFDQFRFYCFKKKVGRVFHIKTALNDLGEAAVHAHTLTEIENEDFPKACGSFEYFDDDNSSLSRNCSKWGRVSSDPEFEVNRWGTKQATAANRMYNLVAQINFDHAVQMISRKPTYEYSCDDPPLNTVTNLVAKPLSVGDVWMVYVR